MFDLKIFYIKYYNMADNLFGDVYWTVKNKMKQIKFLKDRSYRVFMINEVLPGCRLDCRNL